MNKNLSYLKYIGRLLTIVALILIVKKMISYDLDYTQLLHPRTMLALLVCTIAYMFSVLTSTIPWLEFVEIISEKKIPYLTAVFVNVRSNILKYIPGNVFQYIGKNELALKCNISHFQVATSTILDVALMLIVAFGLGILCVGQYFRTVFKKYLSLHYVWILSGIGFLILIVMALYFAKRPSESIAKKVCSLFKKKNILKLAAGFSYYILQNFFIGGIYIIILLVLSDKSMNEIPIRLIIGSNILSGVLGFVTPGAPGGIGIRELAMIYITRGQLEESIIMLTSVVYRFMTIVGDGFAFFSVYLYQRIRETKNLI